MEKLARFAAGSNQAFALGGRTGLRFAATWGGATTCLILGFLPLATIGGSDAVAAMVPTLAGGAATTSFTPMRADAGVTTSLAPALAGGAATERARICPSPLAFANADRCAA